MLQDIRDNAQGTIAKVIVGVIIFTFALFGVDSIIGSLGGDPQVATVNGVEISEQEFNNSVERNRRQILNQMGDKADPALIDESLLRKSVLDDLISQTLRIQAATDKGLYISDSLVDEIITGIPQFQVNGKFDNNQFISMIGNLGQTTKQFRATIKKEVLVTQARNGLIGSEFSLTDEMQDLVSLDRQTRDAGIATFKQSDYVEKVTVSDEQAKAYWESHKEDYVAPEKVDVNYVLLDKNKIAETITVDDEEIQKLYQQELDNFVSSEERHAAHILIEVNDSTSKEEALAKIEIIQSEIQAGGDFTELAKSNSQDLGSAASGGDLGFAGKGTFVPEFEATLFGLKSGEVSSPVLTQYGYHIIKLLEIRENESPTIAELAPSLEESYRISEAEKKYVDLGEQLSNISYTSSNLVDPSDELKLPILNVIDVLMVGESRPIFSNPKVTKRLFSEELKSGEGNSDLIEISKEQSVVLHVKSFKPSRALEFDEAKSEIVAKMKFDASAKMAEEEGRRLLAGLKASTITSEASLKWSDKKAVKRNDPSVSPEVLDRLFSLSGDAEPEKSVYEGFKVRSGDFVIVRLDAVKQGDIVDLKDAEVQSLKRILASNQGGRYYQYYQDYLKKHADIEKP